LAAPDDDLGLLVAAAREAGALAMTFFRKDPKTWAKGATSIVSEADIALDQLLFSRLTEARPDYGWLSEETADDLARVERRRVFVVDPIDGTRGFLAGGEEWTVSIAVVEDGYPVAAALYAPSMDVMFEARVGRGSFRNGRRMKASPRTDLVGASFAGSKRLVRDAADHAGVTLDYYGFVTSLAYRFALVGAGEIDAAIARPGSYDWDLAAADLLVHEAGGRLADLSGSRPRYNLHEPRHPTLLATTPGLSDAVARLVEKTDRAQAT
jgi:myo-inositol-1(or 4)-monophosphatase